VERARAHAEQEYRRAEPAAEFVDRRDEVVIALAGIGLASSKSRASPAVAGSIRAMPCSTRWRHATKCHSLSAPWATMQATWIWCMAKIIADDPQDCPSA
jgi:hypothetical protein